MSIRETPPCPIKGSSGIALGDRPRGSSSRIRDPPSRTPIAHPHRGPPIAGPLSRATHCGDYRGDHRGPPIAIPYSGCLLETPPCGTRSHIEDPAPDRPSRPVKDYILGPFWDLDPFSYNNTTSKLGFYFIKLSLIKIMPIPPNFYSFRTELDQKLLPLI